MMLMNKSLISEAKRLFDAGLQPIPVKGKRPFQSGWQNTNSKPNGEFTQEGITGVGILMGRRIGDTDSYIHMLDIDCYDQTITKKVAAFLRAEFETQGLQYRVGQDPKIAVPVAMARPRSKQLSTEFITGKDADGKDITSRIEVLGEGQQAVVYGQHPDTHKNYCWYADTSRLGLDPDNIPFVNDEHLNRILRKFDELCSDAGYERKKRKPDISIAEPQQGSVKSPVQFNAPSSALVPIGEDFFRNVNNCAMEKIDRWVPALFPQAKFQAGTGAYRITSRSLQRNFEEDLSIHPDGIRDWGEESGKTPIDLIIDHVTGGLPLEAAFKLCETLSVNPETLGYRAKGLDRANRYAGAEALNAIPQQFEDPSDHYRLPEESDMEGDLLRPYDWVIDGLLYNGTHIFTATHGAGKTTTLVTVMMNVIGAMQELIVDEYRHVVYFAEDKEQVERLLHGLIKERGAKRSQLKKRFHLYQAKKIPSGTYVHYEPQIARFIETRKTPEGDEYRIYPVIVFDTVSANFKLESENDSSEVSACIASLRDIFRNYPILLVAHVAKGVSRANVEEQSARGSTAWEADVQGVHRLFKDSGSDDRIWYAGPGVKRRDSGQIKEVAVTGYQYMEQRKGINGKKQDVWYMAASARVSDKAVREAKAKEKADKLKRNRLDDIKEYVLRLIGEADYERAKGSVDPTYYPSKTSLEEQLKNRCSRNDLRTACDELLAEGRLREVTSQKKPTKNGRFIQSNYLEIADEEN